MRKTLFRGKRLDNGEWVLGDLVWGSDRVNPGKVYVCPELVAGHVDSGGDLLLGGFIEVDPETVGEYTLLKDKTKKRIFEGDIVRNHMGFIQVVIFEEGCFLFIELLDYLYGERQGENFCSCSKKYIDAGMTADVVINNIHDSKDILEKYEELDWNQLKALLE